MPAFRVNFTEDLPSQSQVIEINEVRYEIGVRYNSRIGQWYMDIFTEDGDEICVGEALAPIAFPGNGRLNCPTFVVIPAGRFAEDQRVNTLADGDVYVIGAEDD